MQKVVDFVCDLCGKNFLMMVFLKPEKREKVTMTKLRKAYDTHIQTKICKDNRKQ